MLPKLHSKQTIITSLPVKTNNSFWSPKTNNVDKTNLLKQTRPDNRNNISLIPLNNSLTLFNKKKNVVINKPLTHIAYFHCKPTLAFKVSKINYLPGLVSTRNELRNSQNTRIF